MRRGDEDDRIGPRQPLVEEPLWLVRWRDEDGTQKKASYDKKADADRKAAEIGNDLNTGGYIDPTLGKTTFQQFAADWLTHHTFAESSRRATASRLKNHVYPVLGPAPMAKIRPSVIRRWSKGMADAGMATKTQLVIFEQVSSIFIAAVNDGVIRCNPCQDVPRPKPEKRTVEVWEPDTVNTIIGGAPDRYHALILAMATCGHRQGEAFAIDVDGIDRKRREIRIRWQVRRVDGKLTLVPPKGGKTRTAPMANVTAKALAAHMLRYPPVEVTAKDGSTVRVLFTDHKGRLLNASDWNDDVWHPLITAAGMTPGRRTGCHQLRHYYASTLIDGGASMKTVQEYCGHASISITADIYGHLFERSHDRARQIIDAAFGPNTAKRQKAERPSTACRPL